MSNIMLGGWMHSAKPGKLNIVILARIFLLITLATFFAAYFSGWTSAYGFVVIFGWTFIISVALLIDESLRQKNPLEDRWYEQRPGTIAISWTVMIIGVLIIVCSPTSPKK